MLEDTSTLVVGESQEGYVRGYNTPVFGESLEGYVRLHQYPSVRREARGLY